MWVKMIIFVESLGILTHLPALCCLCCVYLWHSRCRGTSQWLCLVEVGVLYVDPKDKCLVPGKERYFKNLETAFSAVRMQCSSKARASYFLKALGKHPQTCCFMDYCFLTALHCQCVDWELMHWGSAGLLWSGTNLWAIWAITSPPCSHTVPGASGSSCLHEPGCTWGGDESNSRTPFHCCLLEDAFPISPWIPAVNNEAEPQPTYINQPTVFFFFK